MQLLNTIIIIASAVFAVDVCDRDSKILNECIQDVYAGPKVENCIAYEYQPQNLPTYCNQTSRELKDPACVCPWYAVNFPCAEKYCPPANLTCLAKILNYVPLCGNIPDLNMPFVSSYCVSLYSPALTVISIGFLMLF